MKPRVVFVGQSGPYAPPGLRRILKNFSQDLNIVGVVDGARAESRVAHRMVPKFTERAAHPLSLWQTASLAGIDSLFTNNINSASACHTLNTWSPDWLICVGFDRLFKPKLLSIPKNGALNAHPSDLPHYRGPSPLFWLLRDGATSSVLSVHLLEKGEDNGDVVSKYPFVFPAMGTGEMIYAVAGDLAGQALGQAVLDLHRGTARPQPQNHELRSRAPRPKGDDSIFTPREFRREHLVRLVMGGWFFCNVALRLGDEVWRVHKGSIHDENPKLAGAYLHRGKELWVQCRDGVAFFEIDPEEWHRIPADPS